MSVVRINITMDDRLLKRVDELADALYTSRSGLITQLCAQGVLGYDTAVKTIVEAGKVNDGEEKNDKGDCEFEQIELLDVLK